MPEKISTTQVASALGLVDRALLYSMLRGMVLHDAGICLDAINQVYDSGYDLTEFVSEMLELLRNATLVVLSKESFKFVDIPEDEFKELESLSKQTTSDVFTRSFQVMLDVHEQVSRSPRPKLILEMAVAKLIAIRPAHSIDDLVSKITKMQGGGTPRKKSAADRLADNDDDAPAQPSHSGFLPSSKKGKEHKQIKHQSSMPNQAFFRKVSSSTSLRKKGTTPSTTDKPNENVQSLNRAKMSRLALQVSRPRSVHQVFPTVMNHLQTQAMPSGCSHTTFAPMEKSNTLSSNRSLLWLLKDLVFNL